MFSVKVAFIHEKERIEKIMSFLPVLAQSSPSMMDALTLPIMIGVMVIWMVVIFRKQGKEQKQHQAMVASVETGDSILTSSGFYGVVTDVSDDVVIVEFGSNKNCRIPMKKDCIAEVEKAK